jgi:hypothetical protein
MCDEQKLQIGESNALIMLRICRFERLLNVLQFLGHAIKEEESKAKISSRKYIKRFKFFCTMPTSFIEILK